MKSKQNMQFLWVLPLLVAAIISGCDYPQAGYYALVGVNHTGEQVMSYPFMVEEITDDSDMTTDFRLLLPRVNTLVEVPLLNSEDTSYRNWSFTLATGDSLAGSFDLSLAHFNRQMKFYGEYQADPSLEPWPVAGVISSNERSAWLEFKGGLPYLHHSLANVFGFELTHITQAEFEDALGCTVSDATRVDQVPVSLDVLEPAPPAKPKTPKKPTTPQNPPTRGTGKRR